MTKLRALVLIVVMSSLAMACGREGGTRLANEFESSSPAPTASATTAPVTSETPAASAAATQAPSATQAPATSQAPVNKRVLNEAKLQTGLLTVADLPSGWSKAESDSSEPGSSPDDFKPCGKELSGVDRSAADASVDFEKEPAFLTNSIDAYRSAADATADLDETRKLLAECPKWSQEQDGVTFTFEASPLSFPTLGDETLAIRLKMNFTGEENGVRYTASGLANIIGVREGQNIVGVFHLVVGFLEPATLDTNETETFARKALAKLKTVD